MMKKIYKAFLLFLFTVGSLFPNLYAQEIEWQNTIGGSGLDQLQSIQQTTDGGYILGGYSESAISGDKTENSNGGWDYWIIKTDAMGNIQWQNTIGGGMHDYLKFIQQTTDGGYILGGQSYSDISGDKTENSIGSYDYWIVKTDAVGNIQWQNTIGGSSIEALNSIQQTADGGYILGGSSYSNISGDKTENCIGLWDYWIVKIDAVGNIQWQNAIGGSGEESLYSIQQTADGGYILGGYSNSNISGDKTENTKGGYGNPDYWVVKTDSLGVIQWQNTIGGRYNDYLYSVCQTVDGGYILGGRSDSDIKADKTENSNGLADYWIVKTDAAGNIQWQNTIGGSNNDYLLSIQQTADGAYILSGYSNSNISGDKTENSNGVYDYWIVKIDAGGNIQWQNTIGGNNEDYLHLRSIQQTVNGGYILGGYSRSNISGDKIENNNGSLDYWIVKLTDKYNTITGKCFLDVNSNNIQDSGEVYLPNKKITESNTGRFSFSEQNGNYSVSVIDTGNFVIAPEALNYFNAVPASYNVNFTGIHQTDSVNDFAYQPAGTINDLRITITPLTLFRSGFNASYIMHYENVGNTTLNASIVFYLIDSNYTFVSSPTSPSLVTADSIIWNSITLAPFQSGDITVTVHVDSGVPIGTQLNAFCVIEPVAGDANPGDNYGSWKVFTTGSYDPNDILVNEDTLLSTLFPNPPYLEYIIRFQNTGNDTCFNAKILNPIDTNKLELSSIEFVASSHPVNLKWIPWERNMEFKFDNILLPDSNINEPLSHGYVRYRIKPKSTLIEGDSIINNAAIYFDFNQPEITNNAVTHITCKSPITSVFQSSCDSYTWTQTGQIYTTSGIYIDSMVNTAGCDSVIILNLTITTVDTSVSVSDPTLTANASGSAFQWIDCNNGNAVIAGATNATYTPTVNGSYAVIVTQNGCADTSSCYNIVTAGIIENNTPFPVKAYPNPASKEVTVSLGHIYPQVNVSIENSLGQQVSNLSFENIGEFQLPLKGATGIYQIIITSEDKMLAKIRVVKN